MQYFFLIFFQFIFGKNMATPHPPKLRNIGIAAHIDAGKTTLTERMLFFSGRIHKIGEVHEGDTIMDFLEEERTRGITISAAATRIEWSWRETPYAIQIIDTPGHVDFTAEVERSMRVIDGLIVLFSAVHGVEPQSETVWRQADRYRVPRMAFINKMDLPGADFESVVDQMKERLACKPLPLQLPIGQEERFRGIVDLVSLRSVIWEESNMQSGPVPPDMQAEVEAARYRLLEALAETDENLFAKFFDAPESITEEEVRQALRQGVLRRDFVPVFCGTAYRNKGVQPLMDAICAYLPEPADKKVVRGRHPKTHEDVVLPRHREAPFSALVFKISLDQQHRKLAFFRVYSGAVSKGGVALIPRTGRAERLSNLYQLHGEKRDALEEVAAGAIGAVQGIKDVRTGDTLCDPRHPVLLEAIQFPEPVIGMIIEARHSRDLDRLTEALQQLQEEDPSIQCVEDEDTGQLLLRGMGELHLEVFCHRLEHDFHLETNLGKPQVTYKEKLTAEATDAHLLHREVGEPLYAGITYCLGPADEAFLESTAFLSGRSKVQLADELPDKHPGRRFLPAVRKGFENMVNLGVIAGYELFSLKVSVTDMEVQTGLTNDLAFELCAREAYRKTVGQCRPVLVEPVMALEIISPETYVNTVIGDLSRRRGLPRAMEPRTGHTRITAEAPLADLFGYAGDLRTLTSGRATVAITFSHYAEVPAQLTQPILDRRRRFALR